MADCRGIKRLDPKLTQAGNDGQVTAWLTVVERDGQVTATSWMNVPEGQRLISVGSKRLEMVRLTVVL